MLLFVGLGNPGSAYEKHRHNVGFMALDRIVERHNFSAGPKRWHADTYEGRLGSEKLLLLKPQTFMNNSGQSVGEAMRFFKLTPEDIVVFYDELDLAFGKIKVKIGGGAAGHNGIRSISSHIGPDFTRVRIGIGHPGDKARVHGHVLGDFAKAEQNTLEDMLAAIANEAGFLADRDNPRFMTEVARRLQPQRPNGHKRTNTEKTKAPGTKPVAAKENKSNDGPMAAVLKALMGRTDKGDE
ncbi:aminoacyl-tRNA hydrolase [Kordiimonas aestuarii]|uniref:aminoacyl-tRNA hydrolase n=1 Tax=Kordiimonas aestuarii TaxID=1005925 RepID=UPI0021CE638E|nr:aminoacyl-tRNA hydrolase [Kordiimonas aestuarii]